MSPSGECRESHSRPRGGAAVVEHLAVFPPPFVWWIMPAGSINSYTSMHHLVTFSRYTSLFLPQQYRSCQSPEYQYQQAELTSPLGLGYPACTILWTGLLPSRPRPCRAPRRSRERRPSGRTPPRPPQRGCNQCLPGPESIPAAEKMEIQIGIHKGVAEESDAYKMAQRGVLLV